MSLLNRVSPVESLQEIESAQSDRYWEAMALAVSDGGHSYGACYLLGYVIELAIKSAYYRFVGASPVADVGRHLQASGLKGRERHDLEAWYEILFSSRIQRGNPMDPVVAGAFKQRIQVAARHWREILRYRRAIPAESECNELLGIADWLIRNHRSLWS
ncbi:MAG: hypothetical protein HOP29_05450 [Phycisphaerales bacterium]|nr:hypothetical protein [Phycisphaerales bacterium]